MTNIDPTPEQICRLVAYLPTFRNPDFAPVVEWLGGNEIEPGVISMPHPRYSEIVLAFMSEASQDWWTDVEYANSGARSMLDRPELIAAASIDQIKSMLTLCVRSERFCDGAWENIFENGYLSAVLERLHTCSKSMGQVPYRRSLLPPIREHGIAADLLGCAADALLSGNIEKCAAFLIESDLKSLREFAYKVCGPISYEIHRQTKYPRRDSSSKAAVPRMPTKLAAREVFERDGWKCRYCGSRVVSKDARDIFRTYCPLEARKGRTNNDNHFGLATLSATIDHVIPFQLGGTNDPVNLVTACGPCQFGKGHWTLDEVQLEDPRSFSPVIDNWDGLTRLVGFKS